MLLYPGLEYDFEYFWMSRNDYFTEYEQLLIREMLWKSTFPRSGGRASIANAKEVVAFGLATDLQAPPDHNRIDVHDRAEPFKNIIEQADIHW